MYGIELVPSISFGRVTEVTNNGHVETHRVYGLPRFSTCMEYGVGIVDGKNVTPSLILIGDSDGSITIIKVPDRKYVFGCRKIRGRVHEIKVQVRKLRLDFEVKLPGGIVTEFAGLGQAWRSDSLQSS